MTLTKKHYAIIGIIVALIVIWYFFLRKKKSESGYTKSTSPCPCAGCKHLPKGHPLCKTCCNTAEESGMASGGGTKKCPKGTYPCKSFWTYWRDECCNIKYN